MGYGLCWVIIRCLAGLQSHSTDSFDMRVLQSSFDSKIQPCHNKTKLSPFVSLCGLGQTLQYEGHSYWDVQVMIKIQNKMVSRIIL